MALPFGTAGGPSRSDLAAAQIALPFGTAGLAMGQAPGCTGSPPKTSLRTALRSTLARQPRRARAVPLGSRDRCIRQLAAGAGRAQHQSTAAHVTASDEVWRKKEALAEHTRQWIDVFPGRDAPEQNETRCRAMRS